MKISTTAILALACISTFAGCRNPINAYTGGRYYSAGTQAETAGDLRLARRNYSRAYANAQAGNLGPAAEAYALYDWARVTGYLGLRDDAAKGFSDVLALIDRAKGAADKLRAPALSEYSRLLHDTGLHAEAVPVFARAEAELKKIGILESDAVGFALLLDDYADSLKAAGFAGRAGEVEAEAARIQAAHPGEAPRFVARGYKA
ncbi:MAG TPA: hypothetical protein VG710_11210 [Opitutus sp.]|nr:hypothetical protein [Opitutus sp.]